MKKKKALSVREVVRSGGLYELEGPVNKALQLLINECEKRPDLQDFRLDFERERWDDGYEFFLVGYRDETPEEKEARLQKEKQEKAEQDARERETLRRLLAKHPDVAV